MVVTQEIMLGKPDWQGFLLGRSEIALEDGNDRPRNRFQSLVFSDHVPHGIDHWSEVTDLSNLRCIDMPWEVRNGSALADIAARGEMPSLEKLRLCSAENYDDDETEKAQAAMNLLLSTLNPLQRLEITGYISPRTLDVLVNRHGENLRYLALKPSRDERSDELNPLVIFSTRTLQHLASHCPQLTHLHIPINRTQGDKHEVGIYRALSELVSLQYLSLEIMYSVGPDEYFWDEEKDGEYPLSIEFTEGDAERIPLVFLQETFSNGVDERLAREIFSLISGSSSCSRTDVIGNKLRYLRLEPRRKLGRNAPAIGVTQFGYTLRWLYRSFVCRREDDQQVTVKELGEKELVSAESHWRFLMSEDEKYYGEEVFVEAFKSLWPKRTDEWWRDWRSLPLDLGLEHKHDRTK